MAYSWICDKRVWNGRRVLLGAFSSALGPRNQRRPVCQGLMTGLGSEGTGPFQGSWLITDPGASGSRQEASVARGGPAVLQPEPG